MFGKFVDTKIFLISLAIGILMVYLWGPTQSIVIVHPTPENHDKVQYEDLAGNCYNYSPSEVKCPLRGSKQKVKEIAVQY